MKKPFYIFMICLIALPSHAHGEQGTFEDRIPRSMLQTGDDSFLVVTMENDMFGGGRGRISIIPTACASHVPI